MPNFEITIPKIDQFEQAYKKSADNATKLLTEAIKQSAIAVQSIARSEAPVKTGKLRAAIIFDHMEMMAVIHPDLTKVPYATYVHGGTGVYGENKTPIIPKQKQVLATKINPGWGSRNSAGYFIIGKQSKGMRANPFMERAYAKGKIAVKRIFKDAERKLIEELRVG